MAEEHRADIMYSTQAKESCYDQFPQWLKDRLEWFQDMKFGLFVHWGVYSQWGCIESWPLVPADTWARPDDLPAWVERGKDLTRFQHDYFALNRTFNPQHFDPAVWAAAAKYAGMRYVAFTTKHHDGFCMFGTRTTDFRTTGPDCPFHTDPHADVVREVFHTFREQDFAIWCYFSKSDWHSPHYWDPERPIQDRNPNYDTHAEPERWQGFQDFVYAQIEELLSGYGHVDCLWLDGGQVRPPDQDILMDRIAEMGREQQPGLLIADRTVGGPHENIITPEQFIPPQPLGVPWESCLTMGTGWSYQPNDTYKSVRTLVQMLVDIVAKGGCFLLNVGPDDQGRFPEEALARLEAIGDWMQINGEAIYGTRPIAPYKEGRICFTQKGGQAYALILAEEGETALPARIVLRGLRPALGTPVSLLGHKHPLAWRPEGETAVVDLPEGPPPCKDVWVVKFTPQT